MNKTLLIISGSSGSGKSTLAQTLSTLSMYDPTGNDPFPETTQVAICTADDYFMDNGEYKFDPSKLGNAHDYCKATCGIAMASEAPLVIVANTTTTKKEAKPYLDLAAKYGYTTHWVFLADTHDSGDNHGVPSEVKIKQKQRLVNTYKELND